MHPSLSVILFTSLSGAGLGLLLVAAVAGWAGLPGAAVLRLLAAGLLLLDAGLVSSVFHLGQPRRAWRAFTQWRSSWLSREAVAALATNLAAVGAGALLWMNGREGWLQLAYACTALGALATLLCTARIYDTLKPIPAWHNGWVLPVFLAAAAHSGWLAFLALAGGALDVRWQLVGAAALGAGFALLKLGYWRWLDRLDWGNRTGRATGLGVHGWVRSAQAPHIEKNYLLHEMGYVVARKHARALRRYALVLAVALPLLLLALGVAGGHAPTWRALACLCGLLGIVIERWLFFAQAEHWVSAYYDARSAPAATATPPAP